MKNRNRIIIGFLLVLAAVVLVACGSGNAVSGTVYQVYYVNKEETKIFSTEYGSETQDTETLLEELIGQLGTTGERMEYIAPLAGDFALLDYTLDNGQLTMNFDEQYRKMDVIREILVRAAIVRTLTQIPDIQYVAFTIQGEMLTDSMGVAVGTMAADTFIDNAGNEINAYEKVNLRLYFANEAGDGLVEENRRNVVYNSNIPLEKLVVEQLVAGPLAQGAYPSINPLTKIVSVNVKDGVCYVNFNEEFLNQPYNVSSDVTIYSITNSLVELPNVNKVQISINGETNISYRENVSLSNVFERNLDLLTTQESD
ncbi:MAG: GerMN domain-containing protein [Lachnospiraceae bacterium]|nr:GerMN domain-containing protein [Lachnospiraceae bacterium]